MKEETVEGEQYVASNGQQIEKYFDLLGIKISPARLIFCPSETVSSSFAKEILIKIFSWSFIFIVGHWLAQTQHVYRIFCVICVILRMSVSINH